MRASRGFAISVFLVTPIASAFAADLTGTWAVTQPVTPTCTLTQTRAAITGSCKGPQAEGPVSGTITGKEVTFTWTRTALSTGQPTAPIVFTATFDAGTMVGKGVMGDQSGAFTA